jgi:membrane protein implicated in regulation of membrane protease activity
MRRISTPLGVLLSAALFILGLYLVHSAISVQSEYGVLILVVGAVSFSLGLMTLVFAVKSILWHRRMLRRSVRKQKVDRSNREYSLR